MMTDASREIQAALHSKLATALAPVPVYDDVPPTAGNRYVTIGDDDATDASSKDKDGQEHLCEIHVWDSTHRGRQGVKELGAAIYASLHNQTLTVTGFGVSFVWWEWGTTLLDEDGLTIHGVNRYRIRVQG